MAHARCAIMIMVACTACVPFAVPPTTMAGGVSHSIAAGSRTGGHGEIGFAPLQLSRSELDRPWDATLSGTLDHFADHNAWGAALAAGPILHPWGPATEHDTTSRLMPQLAGRWTTDMRAAAIRVIIERSIFVDGMNSDGTVRARGEASYGAYIEAGPQWTSTARDSWAITVGVMMRTPAAAGISCCLFL
jgi:hypothetical protein